MKIFNKIHKRKIIILIHGLANKPPKNLLEKWCDISIREGLNTINKQGVPYSLQLVYWADLMHERPQEPGDKNEKSATYLGDPYTPGDPEEYRNFKPSRVKERVLDELENKLDKIYFEKNRFINIDTIADMVVRNLFQDLDYYYHRACPVARYADLTARDAIRSRLAEQLYRYRDRDILLVAQSMGTIISYDVLTQTVKDVPVDTFITIGSPLAMPFIRKKILLEQGKDFQKERFPRTPENIVKSWHNFSDLDDPIAINYNLADDYLPNSRGIAPQDRVVHNNYRIDGDRSPHKIYGYLRAPEVAGVIYDFCVAGMPPFIISMRQKLGKIFGR